MSTTQTVLNQIAPQKNTAPAKEEKKKPTTLLGMLIDQEMQDQFALALPKALPPERFTRIVLTECRKNPALVKTTKESFFGAVMQCAQLGLEPGSVLGQCYLIPYGTSCNLIIGYRGMIELARRSGQIVSINAFAVREKDEFSYELGLHPDIKHKPSPLVERGEVKYVYAVAVLKGGSIQFEVMSRAEVEAVRSCSKAGYGKSSPWTNHWDEMAKKTVVRRLFKYLPISIEAASAMEVDEKTDRGETLTQKDSAASFANLKDTIDIIEAEAEKMPDDQVEDIDYTDVPPESDIPPAFDEPPSLAMS